MKSTRISDYITRRSTSLNRFHDSNYPFIIDKTSSRKYSTLGRAGRQRSSLKLKHSTF